MTTYPLSEPATIHAVRDDGEATSKVLGTGTLAECARIVDDLGGDQRLCASISMDDLDLSYGPSEVDQLVRYLRNEDEGLSNVEIADIAGRIDQPL